MPAFPPQSPGCRSLMTSLVVSGRHPLARASQAKGRQGGAPRKRTARGPASGGGALPGPCEARLEDVEKVVRRGQLNLGRSADSVSSSSPASSPSNAAVTAAVSVPRMLRLMRMIAYRAFSHERAVARSGRQAGSYSE
jgi:hypothetical protein